MATLRTTTIALSAMVFLVSFTACSSGNKAVGGETKVNNASGYIAEYQAETTKWSLPTGINYPSKPRGDLSGKWEVGTGKTEADMIWRCSWEKEWLDNQGADSVRANAALVKLDTWKTTHEYSVTDENGHTFFADAMQKAHLGDPSGFRETYPVQC